MKWPLLLTRVLVTWRRQGWVFRAGLAMLILAGLAYPWVLKPIQEEAASLRSKNQTLTRNALQAPATQSSQSVSLEQLLASLPTDNGVLEQVGHVVQLAGAAGVTLDKGEYRLVRESNDGLQRYQLTFPVKTRYLGMRNWLGRALAAVPGLALTSLSLQRDTTQNELVEGRIIFTLYARGP